MDPDAVLADILSIIKDRQSGHHADVDLLFELIDGLDQWLTRGGFYPKRWETNRRRPANPDAQ